MVNLFKRLLNSWQGDIAKRLAKQENRLSGSESLSFSLIGLVLGGITLMTVLSVMNGFQKQFQDNLREIASFHARFTPDYPSLLYPPRLRADWDVTHLFPFTETQVLVQSRLAGPEPALVKGIDPALLWEDASYQELLNLVSGTWDIQTGDVLLGERLAFVLGARVGDWIELTSLGGASVLSPQVTRVKVAGIWESGYYNLNRYTLFMPLEDTFTSISGEKKLLWGIKVQYPQKLLTSSLKNPLMEGTWTHWQQENPVFLGALDFEKKTMTTLLALIFVIVGLNTYYALRGKIVRHQKDLAILKALGASPWACIEIFLREGLFIAFWGGILSVSLGILLSLSLNKILFLLESAINFLLEFITELLEAPSLVVSLSLSVEGANTLPLSIYWSDVLMIFSLIFFSTLFSAYRAIAPLSAKKPLSLLRYE